MLVVCEFRSNFYYLVKSAAVKRVVNKHVNSNKTKFFETVCNPEAADRWRWNCTALRSDALSKDK